MKIARFKNVTTKQMAIDWITENIASIQVFAITESVNKIITIYYYVEQCEEDL